MKLENNHLGQPVGSLVPGWTPRQSPPRAAMPGVYCRLEPLDADRHAESLYAANRRDVAGINWTYLSYGPFAALEDYRAWARAAAAGSDPMFFAVIDAATGDAVGVASYLRIDPANGAIEAGHLNFSPLLQRTRAATEAVVLMMAQAFALGYRRFEWKCDALNEPSRRAALRLGFSFEGVFRQATVVKGRNRDTAWYSVLDREWPELHRAFRRWLDPANFDPAGRQIAALSSLTAPLLRKSGA
ncbi:MAG: N-acetyltransferase [Rhodospirillales bacterium]|nr:N-acetyltransferase [Rhodospirillales bacterium]